MSFLVSAFDPRRIAGQIALLVVLSVVLVHAIFAGMFLLREPGGPDRGGRPLQDRFATAVRVVDAASDPASRQAALAAVAGAFPGFALAIDESPPSQVPTNPYDGHLGHLRSTLDALGLQVATIDPAGAPNEPTSIRVTLHDGTRLLGRLNLRHDGPPEVSFAIWGAVMFIAVTFGLFSLWAARALTSPLTRFSEAAEGFSVDGDSPPLPVAGPAEVRALSRALNRMRDRIRRLVDGRTRMLAAVSHDLRTPITRLRLRAEFVTDEAIRGPMLRDLDQMNAMISGALSHLRDGQSGEIQAKVDLSSLLSTIADDFCDIGHEVAFEGPQRLVVLGRSDEIARAVTNLVENALKYGKTAAIRLRAFPSVVEIDVVDEGPGIPASLRDAMMQPFARGDSARNLNSPAGFGLGLSIVHSVAAAHGGSLTLLDGEFRGLVARLTLPRPPVEEPAREPARPRDRAGAPISTVEQ
jgi:signal transduction histidine kinase